MTTIDMKLTPKSDWIEMFPFGIVMGANNLRPVMIFKDKSEKKVLPVWMSPMDAGIAMAQANTRYQTGAQIQGSPHEISWQILSQLGISLDSCLFRKVTKHQQYVELHFKKDATKKNIEIIEAKADDAISFCLRSGCKFFATHEYIESSRVLEAEIVGSAMINKSSEMPPKYIN